MTVTVLKSTISENIYKNFYDLVSGISTPDFSTIVYPTFPENITFEDKSDYPIIIIDSVNLESDSHTYGKGTIEGTIDIDIYTTDAKTADQYSSDIIDKIETSKGTLAGVNLREVHLNGSNKEVVMHGEIRIHHKMLTFRFKFYYNKTKAY